MHFLDVRVIVTSVCTPCWSRYCQRQSCVGAWKRFGFALKGDQLIETTPECTETLDVS